MEKTKKDKAQTQEKAKLCIENSGDGFSCKLENVSLVTGTAFICMIASALSKASNDLVTPMDVIEAARHAMSDYTEGKENE